MSISRGVIFFVLGFLIPVSSGLRQIELFPGVGTFPIYLFITYQIVNIARQKRVVRLSLGNYSYLIFGILLFISLFFTRAPNYGLNKAALFFLYFILFGFSLYSSINNKVQSRLFVSGITFGSLFFLCLSLLLLGSPFTLLNSIDRFDRVSLGDESNPIIWAQFLGVGALLFVWKVKTLKKIPFRILYLVCAIFCLMFMLLSGSKGPLVGFVVAALLFFDVKFGKIFIFGFIAGLLIFLLGDVLVNVSSNAFIVERFSLESLGSYESRADSYATAIDAYLSSRNIYKLFMGYGVGDFAMLDMGVDIRHYPHNLFIEVLYETGLVGLVFFIIGVGSPVISCLKYKNHSIETNTSYGKQLKILLACYIYSIVAAQFTGDLGSNWLIIIFGSVLLASTNQQSWIASGDEV